MNKGLLFCLLGTFACFTCQAHAATQFHRIIWDRDPAHNATLGFTSAPSSKDPSVRYGFSTDESTWQTKDVDIHRVFQLFQQNFFVQLSNLPADSNVYYRVCDQDGCGQRFWFKTAPTDNSPYVVVAGGDSRNGWTIREMGNKLVAKIRPLFIMHGGDYTNLNTFPEMNHFLDDWTHIQSEDEIDGLPYKRIYPVVPTHGNHEDIDLTTLCNVFGVDFNQDGRCGPRDTFGAFNVSPLLRVYTLNSQFKNSGWSSHAVAMNQWLEHDLANQGASAKWRIAQYHKPMFPHYTGKSDNEILFQWWSQAFHDHAMNLVVESDTHINKITQAIVPDGDSFKTTTEGGTVYVGEGSWGANARSANQPKEWTIDLASVQQFKVIQVMPDELVVRTAQFDDTAEALTWQQRAVNPTILPEGVNWWLANEIGEAMTLVQADNRLSVIDKEDVEKIENNYVSLASSQDTFVASAQPDSNFNEHEKGLLVDGEREELGKLQTLVKFDLANLSECVDPSKVQLVLDINNTSFAEFQIHSLNQDWQEQSVSWNSLNASEYKGQYLASFKPRKPGRMEVDLSYTGVINQWLTEGNHGLVITTKGRDGVRFASRESGDGPVLKLSYDASESCLESGVVEASLPASGDTEFNVGDGEQVVFKFVLTSDTLDAEVQNLSLKAEGDIDETSDIGNVSLYADMNQNGVPEAGERVASGGYDNDNGELTFELVQPLSLSIGDTHFLVTYQF